ncbi:MAG: hypothetical protein ACM34K_02795 [Bacillota bacterium]
MKINKKILFTVLFFFVLSNTGLPVILHFCGMGKTIKFESCNMCKKAKAGESYVDNSMDSGSDGMQLSKVKHNCCDSKVLAAPISAKYISVKVDNDNKAFVLAAIIVNSANIQDSFNSENSNLFINSPPPGQASNSLYLTNSVLLI